jgi:hypothetical protein
MTVEELEVFMTRERKIVALGGHHRHRRADCVRRAGGIATAHRRCASRRS